MPTWRLKDFVQRGFFWPRPTSVRYGCGIIAVLAALVTGTTAGAQGLLRQAHFDAANVSISAPNSRYRLLHENGEVFFMPHQGQAAAPRLSDKVAMDGARSLGLTIGPSAAGQSANDRSEFTVSHQGDPQGMRLGRDRYLGFAIFFNGDFPPPTAEIIVCQVWQAYRNTPTGPPAFIVMVPGDKDLRFRLATRNDDSVRSLEVPLTRAAFVRDQWNSVVLHVLPRAKNDPSGPGWIEMWLNGNYIGGAMRSWGYAAANSLDRFDVRIGLYANPEPVAHSVWVDSVRWGTSRAAVDPGNAPVKPKIATH